jgi:predicted double-glycine peptidase
VALAAAAVPSPARAQSDSSPVPLLDVPFLPQSEALCGGAAIAMVMRYWGTSAVYAETFADLVDADAKGIRGRELIRALEGRGYSAVAIEGDASRVQDLLAKRRPAIALIEDRPGRFHYVVIVGWRGNRVIVHDPARSPFRVLEAEAFTRAWSASRFWTLVAEPRTAVTASAVANSATNAPSADAGARRGNPVCTGMVEEGIRTAVSDLAGAQRILEMATTECPLDPAPWRELAGVRALRSEWSEAARDAGRALERDPTDRHSARILASALFLLGRDIEALNAWNRIGVPVVDLADIRGLERTRYAVAARALNLEPETMLTGFALARGRRRLEALPSLLGSRVTYEPREDDRAKVMASVLERSLFPSDLVSLSAAGIRAATDRELSVAIASPTGGGELWTAAWRWWERRPRLALGVEAPSPFGGIWSLEALVENQTYGAAGSEIMERRRGVMLTASDWTSGATRIKAGAAVDQWDRDTTASLVAGVERTFAGGLGRAMVDGSILVGGLRASTMAVTSDWRSSHSRVGSVWSTRGGLTTTTSETPWALLPGAGTGQGREVLLRAHPLLHDGVVRGVFGRRLVHAGVEWSYWRTRPVVRALRLAPALFVDTGRAFAVPAFGDRRAHVDAGAGIRVALPGAGVLRADVAHGLRDGRTVLSFGWIR